MEYVAQLNGQDYNLPRYTNGIKKKIDQILNEDTGKTKIDDDKRFLHKYEFIKNLIGEENAREVFGTDNMDEIDLNEITVSYVHILNAYEKPIDELDHERKTASFTPEDREMVMELLRNSGNIQNLEKILSKSSRSHSGSLAKGTF